jgi:hypothetical protein
MDTVLHPASDSLLKMQAVYSTETLLHRPQVILRYTILFFFTTVKNRSKKLGHKTKVWMVHAGKTE